MVRVLKGIYGDIDISIGGGLDYMATGKFYGVYDISRARNELGYVPQYDLESGIKDYIETMERLKL
jgi:UDP-glucose 4-epimerase